MSSAESETAAAVILVKEILSVRLGKVNFRFTPSADQFADGLTKPLPADVFKRHRAAQLGRAPGTFDETTPNEACKKTIDYPLYSESNA